MKIPARSQFQFRARQRTLELGHRTCLMGIINVTPDSFSDGGQFEDPPTAIDHALRLIDEGADILDIGGESSRPGSQPVSARVELERVLPVLEGIRARSDIPLSIDTCKAAVALQAIQSGADIVNDISSLSLDPDLSHVVSESGAGLVLMHMRGTPATMQTIPPSPDILSEVFGDLRKAVEQAAEAGVADDRIILDPGLGFGKTVRDNLLIINQLGRLQELGFPILVGPSRKSFLSGAPQAGVSERIFGTAAAVAASVIRGAHVVRVHDVSEMRQVTGIVDAIVNELA